MPSSWKETYMTAEKYSFDRYLNVRSAYGASFSPDGRHLSFLTDITGVAEVWNVPMDIHSPDPSWPDQLTFRGERVASATFSPTDNALLVAADVGGNERTQLYTLSADGSTFTNLTDRPEVIYQFGDWSPDGKSILYSSNERDGRYFDVYELSLENQQSQQLLQHDGTNYPISYSPDGLQVLVSRHESNTRNQLMLINRATRDTRTLTPPSSDAKGPAEYANPAWSADRHGLYLLSNAGRQFLSLARLDLATSELTYLRDESWDAEQLALTDDGTRMALVTNEDVYSRLELFDVSTGWDARRELPLPALPQGTIPEISWSPDGTRLALTLNTANDAPDIWIWNVEEQILCRATRSSLGGIPQDMLVMPSLVHYPTFDGREIPAFLYLPPNRQSEELPIVIYVHGGPESQSRPIFNPVIQYFVAHGFGVLAPNVRGSTGYGYQYQSLDDVRLRMDSVADLQQAVFWLCQSGIADPEQIAVMGGSYGGFMVLSAITTYPDLWAAAVDIVGIANFVTFLENTGPWRRKLREAEYGSLENDRAFLEQISPIRSVDRIVAPLFVVHGANDPRVPVGEAEQIVAALRSRNVPVEYMRFEDEGHGLIKRANRLVAYPAIARFLDAYLG
jgi:dipeptidyl aminopeptidase/acylaminoacyl peptidase